MKRLRNRQLRISRTLLVVTGLIFLAIGGIGIWLGASSSAHLGDTLVADGPVLNDSGHRLLDNNEVVFQLGALLVAVLLIVIGLIWLNNQIPPVRHQKDSQINNSDGSVVGHNTVAGGALAAALEGDLERAPSIRSAKVEFRPDADLVRLRLDVVETSEMKSVLSDFVFPAVKRASTVAELGKIPRTQTDIRLVERGARRIS